MKHINELSLNDINNSIFTLQALPNRDTVAIQDAIAVLTHQAQEFETFNAACLIALNS